MRNWSDESFIAHRSVQKTSRLHSVIEDVIWSDPHSIAWAVRLHHDFDQCALYFSVPQFLQLQNWMILHHSLLHWFRGLWGSDDKGTGWGKISLPGRLGRLALGGSQRVGLSHWFQSHINGDLIRLSDWLNLGNKRKLLFNIMRVTNWKGWGEKYKMSKIRAFKISITAQKVEQSRVARESQDKTG